MLGVRDRPGGRKAAAKSVGRKIEPFYFAFGGSDVFTVADPPTTRPSRRWP
ncbi:MAG: hypothetical protein ACRDJP_13935 [Actinomycetota bacterium]